MRTRTSKIRNRSIHGNTSNRKTEHRQSHIRDVAEDPNYVPTVTGVFRAFWLLINIYHIKHRLPIPMCQASQILGSSREWRVQALQTITSGRDAVAGKPRPYPSLMPGSPKTQNRNASQHLARATHSHQQELPRDTRRQWEEIVFTVSCQRGHPQWMDSPPNPCNLLDCFLRSNKRNINQYI